MSFEVSGVSGLPNLNPAGRASSTNGAAKLSPAMQTVVEVFNVKGPMVLQRTPGIQLASTLASSLASIQNITPTPIQLEALRELGIRENVVLTLVVSDEVQRARLKNRFKEVALSALSKDMLGELEKILDTEIEDAVIDDNGALIMLNGMRELEESMIEE